MPCEKTLPRIAAIHDLSCVGKCSLTVALPVISCSGVECACIPTAVLSTHTGEFTGYTMTPLSDDLLPIARHWDQEGVTLDGIYTGYLASPQQERQVEQVLDLLAGPDTLVVVDPVMADNGRYYANLGEPMRQAFLRLCRRAKLITPNITEAALLAGLPHPQAPHSPACLEQILDKLSQLGPRYLAVTGVHPQPDQMGNLLLDVQTGETTLALRPVQPGVFYGTGDLFASALSALLVRGLDAGEALELATQLVADSIAISAQSSAPRRFGVAFEQALPAYMARVQAAFDSGPSGGESRPTTRD